MLSKDFKEFIELLNENDFIDIENLKKNKRATGRPQDLADAENLE
jgi:hypothetical protein